MYSCKSKSFQEKINLEFNPFMQNVEKWANILSNSCDAHTTRFLKYVWPLFNIINGGIKSLLRFSPRCLTIYTKSIIQFSSRLTKASNWYFQDTIRSPSTGHADKCLFGNTIMWTIFVDSFHILAQFPFTTSERGLDCYHQKVNIPVSSRVTKRNNTEFLKKLGNFKKISAVLGITGKVLSRLPKK